MKVNTINEGVSVSHAWCHAISIILPSVKTYMFVIPLFFKKLLIDLRERENCCSTYLCIPWLILACVLTGDPTCNLGASGWHSNQLSYPARAVVPFHQLRTAPTQSWEKYQLSPDWRRSKEHLVCVPQDCEGHGKQDKSDRLSETRGDLRNITKCNEVL